MTLHPTAPPTLARLRELMAPYGPASVAVRVPAQRRPGDDSREEDQ